MSRPPDVKIVSFMKDLVAVQRSYDLWIDADENNPLFVSNDQMDGEDIKVFWDAVGDGKPVEHLVARLESEELTTREKKKET